MSAFQGTSLHPSRATHVRTYESNFRDVVARIQTAVQRAQVSPEKYTNVGAVSLRWSNDDMNLAGIEEDLLRAFANGWNIKGEKYLINDQNPNRAIELAVYLTQTVIKFNSETSLLVVIYQGHAVRTGLNQDELSIMYMNPAFPLACSWLTMF